MTELEETLNRLMRHVPGATFAAVGGMDGLLVEQAPDDRAELPEVVAEWTTVLSILRRTVEQLLDGGAVQQLALDAEDLSAAIWIVSEDFYCVVVGRIPIDLQASRLAAREAVASIRQALT